MAPVWRQLLICACAQRSSPAETFRQLPRRAHEQHQPEPFPISMDRLDINLTADARVPRAKTDLSGSAESSQTGRYLNASPINKTALLLNAYGWPKAA